MKNSKLILTCIICIVFFIVPVWQIINCLQQTINPICIGIQFGIILIGVYLLNKKTDNIQKYIEPSVNILKNYRLFSKTYVNMSYFIVFLFLILNFSKYVVANKITLTSPLVMILPFIVLLIIPIGLLYYSTKTGIEIYQISKNKKTEKPNKYLLVSDIIYIATVIYTLIISYNHGQFLSAL